jgi:hypothetical protein
MGLLILAIAIVIGLSNRPALQDPPDGFRPFGEEVSETFSEIGSGLN